MSKYFTIKETDIYRLILDELNDNVFNIKFNYADYLINPNNKNALMIMRYALNEDRFDIVESFDEETYSISSQSFVAVNIPVLNGEPLPLKDIKDFSYSPNLEFLVPAENEAVMLSIFNAIENVRYRLMQYQRPFIAEYIDVDDKDSPEKVKETFMSVFTAGGIEKGGINDFNGMKYIVVSLQLYLQVTNKGLFGNQEKIMIGCNSITEGGQIKMFEMTPLDWVWGTAQDIETNSLLADRDLVIRENAMEAKSLPKSRGFSFTITFQLDLKNELHRHFYKLSRNPHLQSEIYRVLSQVEEYNDVTKKFENASDLEMDREMILNTNSPNESISIGEKVIWSLSFVPRFKDFGGS